MRLSTRQWNRIRPYLSHPKKRKDGKGRPRLPDRKLFEGILWVLETGGRWRDVPACYYSSSTCFRRFHQWCEDGSIHKAYKAFLKTLDKKHRLDWDETFIDGSFVPAKRGAITSLAQVVEKVPDGWLLLKGEEDYLLPLPSALPVLAKFLWSNRLSKKSH